MAYYYGGGGYGGFSPYVAAVVAGASNLKCQGNPPYTQEDFFKAFQQFDQNVPGFIVDQFIAMADNFVQEARWHSAWKYGMGLFVAHFCTNYMLARGTEYNPTAQQVIANGQAKGLQTSKAVGDVSVSYDAASLNSGLEGWANWTSTSYGREFATLAKMLGKAGMYIW